MIAVPMSAQVPIGRDANPKPFLASYRALSVCTRELARLTGMITADVIHLSSVLTAEKPQVRQTPARCIIQLGPVALTLAWLRSTLDSAASGELLVIVWRGAVAPQRTHCPERSTTSPAANAITALWEEAFIAVATSEATWTWQRGTADGARYSSPALAARCVEQLRLAHVDA